MAAPRLKSATPGTAQGMPSPALGTGISLRLNGKSIRRRALSGQVDTLYTGLLQTQSSLQLLMGPLAASSLVLKYQQKTVYLPWAPARAEQIWTGLVKQGACCGANDRAQCKV